MKFIKEWSGVVALVILAISFFFAGYKGTSVMLGSATTCTDGYSCYTNVEVQGNLITDGTSSFTGATTLGATTTINAGSLILKDSGTGVSCIQFYATSTATIVHLGFYATSSITAATGVGLLSYIYGPCL